MLVNMSFSVYHIGLLGHSDSGIGRRVCSEIIALSRSGFGSRQDPDDYDYSHQRSLNIVQEQDPWARRSTVRQVNPKKHRLCESDRSSYPGSTVYDSTNILLYNPYLLSPVANCIYTGGTRVSLRPHEKHSARLPEHSNQIPRGRHHHDAMVVKMIVYRSRHLYL